MPIHLHQIPDVEKLQNKEDFMCYRTENQTLVCLNPKSHTVMDMAELVSINPSHINAFQKINPLFHLGSKGIYEKCFTVEYNTLPSNRSDRNHNVGKGALDRLSHINREDVRHDNPPFVVCGKEREQIQTGISSEMKYIGSVAATATAIKSMTHLAHVTEHRR